MDEQSETPWTLSQDPLLSCILTLYCLILLYFPQLFLRIFLSPILLITGTLLISLVRLGSTREPHFRPGIDAGDGDKNREHTCRQSENRPCSLESRDSCKPELKAGLEPNPGFMDNFVEWNVKAPLEVIQEEEEEEDCDVPGEKDPTRFVGIERLPSLSLCYPESESDSDSDSSSNGDFPVIGPWDSPENICYRWEEEDGEGLIEIRLDDHSPKKSKQMGLDYNGDEENLIEIDISPTDHFYFRVQ